MCKKLTTEEFILKAKLKHGDRYDYSLVNYIGNKIHIKIICNEHGIFEQKPNSHLDGNACPDCGLINKANNKRKTNIRFIEEANRIHNNLYNYSLVDYKYTNQLIKIICSTHGMFEQTPHNHLNGSICPKCSYDLRALNKTSNTYDFINKAKTIHKNNYDYSLVNYENVSKKIIIICPIHGEFKQLPSAHLTGNGCSICKESKGEKTIREFLLDNDIIFIKEHRFVDCKNKKPLPFDFYLPEQNTCIEFNGKQHYEPIDFFGGMDAFIKSKKRDKIKIDYCNNNNISLITIKYDDNIESYLRNWRK